MEPRRVVWKMGREDSLLISCSEQNGNCSCPRQFSGSRNDKFSFFGLAWQVPKDREWSVGDRRGRLHQIRVIQKIRHGRQRESEPGNLLRVAVVLLELPNCWCRKSGVPPGHSMAVYLLGDVAKEREASILWDGGCERANHLRREVLSFVDDYMPVTARPLIDAKLVEHCAREIAPVIRFAGAVPLPPVALIEIEQDSALSPGNAGSGPSYALRSNIILLVHYAVLLYPFEFLVEEFRRPLQNRALHTAGLRFIQCETDEAQPVIGAADAL